MLRPRLPALPRFIIALAAALLAGGAAWAQGSEAALPRPDPALWKVSGAHATVYLFGTVHALRPDRPWRSAKIERALAESGTLWEEIADDDPQTLAALVAQLGVDRAHPLSTRLAPADLARVDAAAKAAGLPGGEAALEPLRPWMAALTLDLLPLTRAGYAPGAGVDKQLKAEAVAAGKPVRAFETAAQQIHFFADLPPATEVGLLRSSLDDADQGTALLDRMVDAWARGDVDTLARLETADLKREAPGLYATLLVKRNQAWADGLAERLRGTGTIFVAVGAGHLAGPDSLQRALERRGFKAMRQ